MRELNECRAEIFRRSKEKIKRRKKIRLSIIACCIPLCFCIAVWSVFILPAMMPAGSDYATDYGAVQEDVAENTTPSFAALEIRDDSESSQPYLKITDTYEVLSIHESILSLYDTDDAYGSNPEIVETEDKTESLNDSNSGRNIEYTITFISADGSETVFRLYGNKLFDVDADREIQLSDEKLSVLKAVLGIED